MACRDALKTQTSIQPQSTNKALQVAQIGTTAAISAAAVSTASVTVEEIAPTTTQAMLKPIDTPFFGVDSESRADTLLQHNLTLFEWATKNKIYPNFFGRNITGENVLTTEEVKFLHSLGCKIAPIYYSVDKENNSTEQDGAIDAKNAFIAATRLGIPSGKVIFLKVDDSCNVSAEYLYGFIKALSDDGYIPGIQANTDAKSCDFGHQFSKGHFMFPEEFGKCLLWTMSPILPEFFETNDAHHIHPDVWKPHCPSAFTREQIAIWQYGQKCHAINDDMDNMVHFNVDLIKDAAILVQRLF